MTEAATTETPRLVSPKTLDGGEFPLDSFKEAARELRRPFTENAVKFKLQSTTLVVTYIDARLVIERLNLVIPHLWHDAYREINPTVVECLLTVDGIPRSDVGEAKKAKDVRSDALKRAAVHFGIGVSLYAIPAGRIDDTYVEKQGKSTVLSPNGITMLRSRYTSWLEARGKAWFGDPLDHGDVEDAAGDVELEAAQPEPTTDMPAQPEPLKTPAALALFEKAENLRKGISAKDLPKALFDRQLAAAVTDQAELEKFVARLEGMQS